MTSACVHDKLLCFVFQKIKILFSDKLLADDSAILAFVLHTRSAALSHSPHQERSALSFSTPGAERSLILHTRSGALSHSPHQERSTLSFSTPGAERSLILHTRSGALSHPPHQERSALSFSTPGAERSLIVLSKPILAAIVPIFFHLFEVSVILIINNFTPIL